MPLKKKVIIMFTLLGVMAVEGTEHRLCCFCLFCLDKGEGDKGEAPGCSPNGSNSSAHT